MVKEKQIILITFFFLWISIGKISAQPHNPPSAFISTNGGVYIPKEAEFSEYYGSNIGPTVGAVAGVPFGKRLYLVGRLNYFRVKDTNEVEMWLTNVGLKYAVQLPKKFTLEISGGFARAGVQEKIKNRNGTYSTNEGVGVFGGFYGLGLEKKVSNLPLKASVEIVKNTSIEKLKLLYSTFDGTAITVGIRYYLPAPKKKRRP